MRKSISSLAAAAVVITGCGSDQQAATTTRAAVNTGTTVGAMSVAPTTGAAPTTAPDECAGDRKTLEVAVEAYYAQNGVYPQDTADLVGTYTRQEITSYTIGTDGSITRALGEPCAVEGSDEDFAPDMPTTADEFYALFSEEEITSFGGPECAAELAVIGAAGQVFIDREQREPLSLDELTDDFERPITLWVYDAEREMLAPAPGSPCVDLAQDNTPQGICDQKIKDLETANQAYYAENGSYPGSQQDLLDAGMIRDEIDGFTVAGGSVAPDAGTDCEMAWAPPSLSVPAGGCEQDRRSLEVAIEAYQAQFGSLPDNEQVLIDAGMIRTGFDTYDVVYGEIVPGDGSPCL